MYKHVIYIKECKPSTIVQHEQYILQRNTKMRDKKDGDYYKLWGTRKWNFHHSESKLSLIVQPKHKKKLFTADEKTSFLPFSLDLGPFRPFLLAHTSLSLDHVGSPFLWWRMRLFIGSFRWKIIIILIISIMIAALSHYINFNYHSCCLASHFSRCDLVFSPILLTKYSAICYFLLLFIVLRLDIESEVKQAWSFICKAYI